MSAKQFAKCDLYPLQHQVRALQLLSIEPGYFCGWLVGAAPGSPTNCALPGTIRFFLMPESAGGIWRLDFCGWPLVYAGLDPRDHWTRST